MIARSTTFPVGLEEGRGGAVHVHSFSVPGCVGTGATRDEALDAFVSVLADWLRFLGDAGERVPMSGTELEISVDEWIATGLDVASGESNVCFEADRTPLSDAELQSGIRILGDLRGRILPHVRRARNADLEAVPAMDGNVRSILEELARAQWWTLTRLGASPLAEVPEQVVARLDTAMALVIQFLGHLPDDEREGSIVLEDEEWTPRKVLRRLLWLEWALGGAALRALSPAAVR